MERHCALVVSTVLKLMMLANGLELAHSICLTSAENNSQLWRVIDDNVNVIICLGLCLFHAYLIK